MEPGRNSMIEHSRLNLEKINAGQMSAADFFEQFHIEMIPFLSLMSDYQCAILEVETKFRVLNTKLAINGEENPIESIKTRIKSPESIVKKLESRGYPITMDSVCENIRDIAGVRVICSFIDDIYRIEKLLLQQDDVTLISRKDYIENPKPSGYRSLHLVIKTPIFTETGKKEMYVEVQMRPIAMDFWASLEHKLRYKKDLNPQILHKLSAELENCASQSAVLDRKMQNIRNSINQSNDDSK